MGDVILIQFYQLAKTSPGCKQHPQQKKEAPPSGLPPQQNQLKYIVGLGHEHIPGGGMRTGVLGQRDH